MQQSIGIQAGPDHHGRHELKAPPFSAAVFSWTVLGAGLALAGATWVWAGSAAAGGSTGVRVDPELLLLLRFMAAVKTVAALGALLLVAWRIRQPASATLRAAYAASALLMAPAPGLIWGGEHIVLAALLFHAGLLVLLALGWADRGKGWQRWLPAGAIDRRQWTR